MKMIALSCEPSRWPGTPSPELLWMMLRIAERNPTSPRKRGEVKRTNPFHLSPLAAASGERLAPRLTA